MISKMEKAKKGDKKAANNKAEEKPVKVIKKVEVQTPKAKKTPKVAEIKKAVKAGVVKTKASPKVTRQSKKKAMEIVKESSDEEEEEEVEEAEIDLKKEEDSEEDEEIVKMEEDSDEDDEDENEVKQDEDSDDAPEEKSSKNLSSKQSSDEDEDEDEELEEDDTNEDEKNQEDDSDNDAAEDESPKPKKQKSKLPELPKMLTVEEDNEDRSVCRGHTLTVKNLPPHVKRGQIANLFEPYGKVLSILFQSPDNLIFFQSGKLTTKLAYVIVDSIETANKALDLNGTPLQNKLLSVTNSELRENTNPSNTVYVSNLNEGTTRETLRNVFSTCGEIVFIALFPKTNSLSANIIFQNPESVAAALKLNGTSHEGQTLEVSQYVKKTITEKIDAANRTIFVKNLSSATTEDTLRETFSQCGSLESVTLKTTSLNTKFAFICFKEVASVDPALKLNGSELDDQQINVYRYSNKIRTHNSKGTFKPKFGSKNKKPGFQNKKPGFQNKKPGGSPFNKHKDGNKPQFKGVSKNSRTIGKPFFKPAFKKE